MPRSSGTRVLLGTALLATVVWSSPARAEVAPARVSVLTMGPGRQAFARFGHNALLLEWDGDGPASDAVFNFGTFDFDGLRGVRDFMNGRFRYWLSITTLGRTLEIYEREGRSLRAQQLSLSEHERAQLLQRLLENARPEHRYYDYDYYRDNCSTRVRDAVDELLGGELARQLQGPGRLSFRQHTLRHVADTPWLYWGLDLALGTPTDRPTTRWEESFLPEDLHDALARSTRHRQGKTIPLVVSEKTLLQSQLPAPAAVPPERRPIFAAWGVVSGALLGSLGVAASRRGWLRWAFGGLTALLAAGLGTLGLALAWFSASKHWAAHDNVSLLACPPWSLALAPLTAIAHRGTAWARWLERTLSANLVTCALLFAFALARWSSGGAEAVREALLFGPFWLGWLLGARRFVSRGVGVTP